MRKQYITSCCDTIVVESLRPLAQSLSQSEYADGKTTEFEMFFEQIDGYSGSYEWQTTDTTEEKDWGL